MSTDVVLCAGSFWPREGGAERQMREVLRASAKEGLRCVVLTQALVGQPRRAQVDGVDVRRLGSATSLRRVPRLGQLIWVVALTFAVLRLRPRTVVSIQLGAASIAVGLARRLVPLRHVVRLTGGGTRAFRSEPWARRSTRLGRLAVRLVASHHLLLVAPAQHLLQDFAAAFPERPVSTRLVPNGVRTVRPDRLRPEAARSGVVWYARSGAVRSVETFVDVVRACPELTFSAFGQTDQLPDDADVRRLGWVEDPFDVLRDARVLLNTSPTEGMPNTALQALAAGMRVVGPSNEGLLELAGTYPDRIVLVDLDDPHASAQALQDAHDAPLPGPAPVPSADAVLDLWRQIFTERD